ncbi:pirin family protein [Phycisphaeraceae bacterium AH-315-B13]|nr:pirin family protein [Phycisphaeraceae bacterium AH-315-B13]
MITRFHAADRTRYGSDAFRIDRIFPGRGLSTDGDRGLGPLGAFDHASLKPGMVVKMHEHRNDEIFSYIRRGEMHHVDTLGNRVPLTPTQFSVMNAGSGMQHEECVPTNGGEVEMMQIFVRPHTDGLPPTFQQHSFDATNSNGAWRSLVAPEGVDAPLHVRNRVWIYDAHLPVEDSIEALTMEHCVSWVYVFNGRVRSDAEQFGKGDGWATSGPPAHPIVSLEPADLVLFIVDTNAAFTRTGTLSG